MKRKLAALLLLLCAALTCCGCEEAVEWLLESESTLETDLTTEAPSDTAAETQAPTEAETNAPAEAETAPPTETETAAETEAPTEPETFPETLDPDGSYTTRDDVAEYLYTYGELPDNFITKNEAKALGWVSSEGNLWDVAPGMSIGGDYFGNYEGLLPEEDYRECDINYEGGYRGSERIIFSEDCNAIYYTNDHYETFTQLY